MSFITEKRAKEMLKEYMAAELSGQDEQAKLIEDDLKEGGWKITNGSTGVVVQKIEKEGGLSLNNMFLPKESGVTPYRGSSKSSSGSNAKPILIALGITVGVVGLILLIRFFIKRNQNATIKAL